MVGRDHRSESPSESTACSTRDSRKENHLSYCDHKYLSDNVHEKPHYIRSETPHYETRDGAGRGRDPKSHGLDRRSSRSYKDRYNDRRHHGGRISPENSFANHSESTDLIRGSHRRD
eukprot:8944187-Ditylum_brightwellii.AAC.1